MLRQMYQMFIIPALWQTGDAKNEILLEIEREILPKKFFCYELHIADIKITKNFQQKFQNISISPWGVTQLLLGNNVKNSCIIKKYNGIFPKILPDCDFNQEVILVTTTSILHLAHSEDF